MKFFNIHFISSNQIVLHNYKMVLFIGFPAAAAAYAAAYAGRGYSGYPGLLAAASYPTGFTSYGYFPNTASNVVQAPVTQSLDQTGRASLGSYYESVASSVSSKESGVQNGGAGGGYHPVISRQESHPMITNTSPGPALVAQALSAMTLKDTCSMLPTLGSYNTGHYGHNSHNNRVFASSNSPGPADNVYNGTGPGHAPDTGYVTANSPQPNPFPAIPINRGPLLTAAFSNGYH